MPEEITPGPPRRPRRRTHRRFATRLASATRPDYGETFASTPSADTPELSVAVQPAREANGWSPLVWVLPAAVGFFFWPTVLIFLFHQVIADFLSERSVVGVVFAWFFGVPLTLFVISLAMWVPYLLAALVVGLAKKWRLTRGLVAFASLIGGLALAGLCVVALLNLFLGSSAEVKRYFEEAKVLNPATEASAERTRLEGEIQRKLGDGSQVTIDEARIIVQSQLAAVSNELSATREALRGLRSIVQPKQCEELHLIIYDSLQLNLQGLGHLESAFFLALDEGRMDSDLIQKGNDFVGRGNLLRQEAFTEFNNCN